MTLSDYVVCIRSYKRASVCNEKTLATLKKNKIPASRIYVYVIAEEYDLYKETLDKSAYNKLVIGKKGGVQQSEFIIEQWPEGKHIVCLDDDIASVDLSLSPMFKRHNLDYFIKTAFKECVKNKAYIWGIYAVFNPFFRGARKEMTTELNFIVGAFYGIINRPKLKSIRLALTKENGQKDDIERTIQYFIEDGVVLRFNKIGFTTKYYNNEGGLGTFEDRIKPATEACKKLKAKYPEYGNIKVRGNGMTEFVLRKIPPNTNMADLPKYGTKSKETNDTKKNKPKNNNTKKTKP